MNGPYVDAKEIPYRTFCRVDKQVLVQMPISADPVTEVNMKEDVGNNSDK